MPLTITANAKINLGLRIVGRRENGLHLLHTLFQEIEFGDYVTLTNRSNVKVILEVTGPAAGGVPTDESNLCIRAVTLFNERTGNGRGIDIRLEKRIPAGAGLGGGSSDAAAVLKGLNQLWQTGMTVPEMEGLAVKLGADVPFFIRGGLQLGEGIGEVLTPLELALPYTVVLVIPPFGVDTAWAYRQFASRTDFPPPPAFDELITRKPIPWEAITNDFEEVVFPHYRQLAEIKAALLEQGAIFAGLSGSGSTVVGVLDSLLNINSLGQRFPDCRVVLVNMVGGAEHKLDSA